MFGFDSKYDISVKQNVSCVCYVLSFISSIKQEAAAQLRSHSPERRYFYCFVHFWRYVPGTLEDRRSEFQVGNSEL